MASLVGIKCTQTHNTIYTYLHIYTHTLYYAHTFLSFPHGSLVKNLPAKQETQVQSLGGEDPPEKEMGTHSSILAWKILRTDEPGGLQSMGSQKIWTGLSN